MEAGAGCVPSDVPVVVVEGAGAVGVVVVLGVVGVDVEGGTPPPPPPPVPCTVRGELVAGVAGTSVAIAVEAEDFLRIRK